MKKSLYTILQYTRSSPTTTTMPTLSSPLGVGHSIQSRDLCVTKTRLQKGLQICLLETWGHFWLIYYGGNSPSVKSSWSLAIDYPGSDQWHSITCLVDNGTTCSFVDEKLQRRPPLTFVGAYSSLEMANGETIVSTGVTPNVLVSIGKIQFWCYLIVVVIDVLGGLVYCTITPSLFFICRNDGP